MRFDPAMSVIQFGSHPMWSVSNGNGGTTTYYYYDAITWVVAALAAAWVVWMLVRRYRRRRAGQRPPLKRDRRTLRETIKRKRELSRSYLGFGAAGNVHGVGIGTFGPDQYCIQVFVRDAAVELAPGAGPLPDNYRGTPLVMIEMAEAGFLSEVLRVNGQEQFSAGIRDPQEIILGGISGANANLAGSNGTIGYFCTRRSVLKRRKEIYLLSNSHVFADLRKAAPDAHDLIVQPSPGERVSGRPIALLARSFPINFAEGIDAPNQVDAAIAKLWKVDRHQPLIPMIGAVKGYVNKAEVEPGETVRKFGRTTGYTVGQVLSIYLDIRIRYDRTGQSAFFQDQILVEPARPDFDRFVAPGDSGSLLVDTAQHAIGLIFAGTAKPASDTAATSPTAPTDPSGNSIKRVEAFGLANPITEVLDRLKIDLVI
jgi:hypothetical protein